MSQGQRPPAHGVGRDDILTPRQLNAIVSLAARAGIDANELAQERYKRQVVDLSVREAGVLINFLLPMQKKQQPPRAEVQLRAGAEPDEFDRALAEFLRTWGPHCGAPLAVFEGHLRKLLQAQEVHLQGALPIPEPPIRYVDTSVTTALKGMD